MSALVWLYVCSFFVLLFCLLRSPCFLLFIWRIPRPQQIFVPIDFCDFCRPICGHYKYRALFSSIGCSLSLSHSLRSSLFYTVFCLDLVRGVFLSRFCVGHLLQMISDLQFVGLFVVVVTTSTTIWLLFYSSQKNDQFSKQTHISTWHVVVCVFTFTKKWT